MARKEITYRLQVADIGEFYSDLLDLDSWIRGSSKAGQASSLICSKLQEREPRIEARLAYLARKRGMDKEELRALILRGEAQRLTSEEIPLPSSLEDDLE